MTLAKNMLLRCYAEGTARGWEAVCLDFDIAVQGDSFESVYQQLNEAVETYVEYVDELPEPDRSRLLCRKAPLVDRLRFLWHTARTTIGRSSSDAKQRHEFTRPLQIAT